MAVLWRGAGVVSEVELRVCGWRDEIHSNDPRRGLEGQSGAAQRSSV